MANTAICAELDGVVDLSCIRTLVKKYFQEIVIINFNDIDRTASVINQAGALCDYSLPLTLKAGKKGVMLKLPENGNTIRGSFAKTTDDNGFVQYLHTVQILVNGVSKENKCILDKLDRGRYVVAAQLADGTVEIYGFQNGLTTGDYTYDLVEGGGGVKIPLQSKDSEQETLLPMVYKSAVPGSENADFNEQFSQIP